MDSLSVPVGNIDGLFMTLPLNSKLDKLIDNGNVQQILTVLNNLAGNEYISSRTKITYVLQVLESIKKSMVKKNISADKIIEII
jgi:hypothetical protein